MFFSATAVPRTGRNATRLRNGRSSEHRRRRGWRGRCRGRNSRIAQASCSEQQITPGHGPAAAARVAVHDGPTRDGEAAGGAGAVQADDERASAEARDDGAGEPVRVHEVGALRGVPAGADHRRNQKQCKPGAALERADESSAGSSGLARSHGRNLGPPRRRRHGAPAGARRCRRRSAPRGRRHTGDTTS